MGRGIAQASAVAGYKTILFDIEPAAIKTAQDQIRDALRQLVNKGRMEEPHMQQALSLLHFTHQIAECRADLVIEAIVEDLHLKQSLFSQLASVNDDSTILATNTSSLSVNQIADSVSNSKRFVGIHFFNPAPVMKLVEIVRTENTEPSVTGRLTEFVQSLGKIPVVCSDAPGFIVNHVARPYYIEAFRLLEAGIEPGLIDSLLESCGFKMGPFRLMDLIGNDVNLAVSQSVYEALDKPERLRPSGLQEKMVQQRLLGRKTGKGFYTYGKE